MNMEKIIFMKKGIIKVLNMMEEMIMEKEANMRKENIKV